MIEWAPQSEHTMTYNEAVLYCQFCASDGHMDWRLPTYQEWCSEVYAGGWYNGRFGYLTSGNIVILNVKFHVRPVRFVVKDL
jgi:hypothetical protein